MGGDTGEGGRAEVKRGRSGAVDETIRKDWSSLGEKARKKQS